MIAGTTWFWSKLRYKRDCYKISISSWKLRFSVNEIGDTLPMRGVYSNKVGPARNEPVSKQNILLHWSTNSTATLWYALPNAKAQLSHMSSKWFVPLQTIIWSFQYASSCKVHPGHKAVTRNSSEPDRHAKRSSQTFTGTERSAIIGAPHIIAHFLWAEKTFYGNFVYNSLRIWNNKVNKNAQNSFTDISGKCHLHKYWGPPYSCTFLSNFKLKILISVLKQGFFSWADEASAFRIKIESSSKIKVLTDKRLSEKDAKKMLASYLKADDWICSSRRIE